MLAVANALLGVALGLFLSAFATSEFQAVQFMPAVLLPQILLSGLFVRARADAACAAHCGGRLCRCRTPSMRSRGSPPGVETGRLQLDIAVVLGTIAVAVTLGATTLRRRTA